MSFGKFIITAFCLVFVAFNCGFANNLDKQVAELKEISAFDIPDEFNRTLNRGQSVLCTEQPYPNVTYPTIKSEKPLYGSILLPRGIYNESEGKLYHFVIDESDGTGTGYNRLWFDSNCNLDFTDDISLSVFDNPPDGALLEKNEAIKQQVCFEYLYIDFPFGSEEMRPLEVLPRFIVSNSDYASLSLITTKVYTGEVEISGYKCNVLLGHRYLISGWFDKPSTTLDLIPQEKSGWRSTWWGSDFLMALHKIGGRYYQFSATPSGNKLYVRPYEGDYGVFKIGSGWRFVLNKKMYGSLLSKNASVAVEGQSQSNRTATVKNCLLPVGDYMPSSLSIIFGNMRLHVSDNYYSDGKSYDSERPRIYSIKIRKDKPFVLDFSNKPEIVFASPAKNIRIRPGEQLQVEAVLVDPKLDIMIRDIESKQSSGLLFSHVIIGVVVMIIPLVLFRFLPPGLRKQYRFLPVLFIIGIVVLIGYSVFLYVLTPPSRYNTIEPRVFITRTDGERVVVGAMPFG